MNNMHEPVFALDETKVVLLANDEVVRALGIKQESLLGKATTCFKED